MTRPSAPGGAGTWTFEAARLRHAALRDAGDLAELYRHARPDEPPAGDDDAPGPLWTDDIETWLEHGGALVLEDPGGRIVSALRWRENGDGWLLDRIATLPDERGQGYGRWLMTKVEALAIQRNIPHLEMHVARANDTLLAYYGRMGYRPADDAVEGTLLRKRVGGTWQVKR